MSVKIFDSLGRVISVGQVWPAYSLYRIPLHGVEGRGAIFDLKCKDANGAVFIVEVQNAP